MRDAMCVPTHPREAPEVVTVEPDRPMPERILCLFLEMTIPTIGQVRALSAYGISEVYDVCRTPSGNARVFDHRGRPVYIAGYCEEVPGDMQSVIAAMLDCGGLWIQVTEVPRPRSPQARARLVLCIAELSSAAALLARVAAVSNGWDGPMVTAAGDRARYAVLALLPYITGDTGDKPSLCPEQAHTCRVAWADLGSDWRWRFERLCEAVAVAVMEGVPMPEEVEQIREVA